MKTAALFCALLLPLAAARAQGTIRATTRVLPDGSTLTAVTDPDKRTREESIVDAAGQVRSKTIFFLNSQNFARGATHLDAKGVIRYKEAYKFDSSGRINESKLFSADDRPLGRRVFIYEGKNSARIEDYDAAGNRLAAGARPSGGRPPPPAEIRRAIPLR